MREKGRIKPFCEKLAYVWEKYFPDWRFCQLMMNFTHWLGRDPFYLEEDDFEKLLEKYVEDMLNIRVKQ